MNVEVPSNSNFIVSGPDCQILSVNLKPGEKLYCQPGSLMFMSPAIKTTTECGSCGRCWAGEALCKVVYENKDNKEAYIAISPNFPAKVIPINLPDYKNKIIAKRGAYMSGIGKSDVDYNCDCDCMTSSFGGLGELLIFSVLFVVFAFSLFDGLCSLFSLFNYVVVSVSQVAFVNK